MPATPPELDARVAALEDEDAATRARTDAIVRAVNSLGQQTRERFDAVEARFERLGRKLDETDARVRSIEESVAELKDLLVRALGNR
ncbi:hypothetical protein ACWDSJ_21390 [Nocardia sp. NPDC003482]|uniref:hypothetical protein n=1 Tax=Nocardia sp. NPDC004068 TaxID=3364303 RepID=UPI0036A91C4E